MESMARLLIVDDDPTSIEVLDHALEGVGEVRCATSGADALALLAQYPIDLVLLDAQMPGMDGFATCHAMQRQYPDLPIIFVTVASDFGNEIRALEAGASDFISKPINPPVVRARVGVHLKLKAHIDLLRSLSGRDPLTGVANRRALDERLIQEWRRAARHQQPLSLLMIDVDYFKAYNDHYGHTHGDRCLHQVAQMLAATVTRAGDLVARYGGEEFTVLLAGSPLAVAVALAEKIRAAVHALDIPHARSTAVPRVTVSIGAASLFPTPLPDSATPPDVAPLTSGEPSGFALARTLFDQADQALYAAKAAGRDRVSVYEP
jgi:diguanylate cyclase (GGDEF)-like protein